MYVLNADIQVLTAKGTIKFTRVNEVEIESSAKVLEDTALIKIPTTARLERQGEFISEVETAKAFKVGDEIAINLGYDGNLKEEFYGFISKIRPGTPLEIECVDAVWLLRRKNLKESFKNVDLATLLEAIVQGTKIELRGEIPGIQFKNFSFRNVTAALALQELKDDYGLTLYLKNFNQLHVGLTSATDNVRVIYGFGENVIENDLEWASEDDTRIRVKAVHIRANNTKVEKEFGDADGELRTLYFYDLEREADLEKMALAEATKYKYRGYRGGLTTFLLPYVEVGNVARLRDNQFAERDGDYLVDKVVTTFGTSGARRKIELGIKVSA
jgi:hypothetical protein